MKKMQLIALAMAAAAFAFSGVANAGISNTKHNMGSNGHWNYTGVNEHAESAGTVGGGTGEICVFCHTPHGANTSGPGPLWNRQFNNVVSSYTMYDSWTIDGTNPDDSVLTGSMLCLSCHDGTQAMDTLVNGPTGSNWTGDNAVGSDQGWDWRESKWMSSGVIGNAPEIPYIGTDLSDDHPVMIQYGGGGLSTTTPAGTLGDADFNMPGNAAAGGTTIWYFDTDASGALSGHDIKMYTYTVGGTTQPYVECYTCHDPHLDDTTPFLRLDNANSAVCLTCHNK